MRETSFAIPMYDQSYLLTTSLALVVLVDSHMILIYEREQNGASIKLWYSRQGHAAIHRFCLSHDFTYLVDSWGHDPTVAPSGEETTGVRNTGSAKHLCGQTMCYFALDHIASYDNINCVKIRDLDFHMIASWHRHVLHCWPFLQGFCRQKAVPQHKG